MAKKKLNLKKKANGGRAPIKDPRTSGYYTPSRDNTKVNSFKEQDITNKKLPVNKSLKLKKDIQNIPVKATGAIEESLSPIDLIGTGLVKGAVKGVFNVGEKLLGTESGLLSNTYKINPWAFKPQEEMMYRGIGSRGLEDAFISKELRSPKSFTNETFWTDSKNFKIAAGHGNDYIKGTGNSVWTPDEFGGFKITGEPAKLSKKIIAEYPKNKGAFEVEYKGINKNMPDHFKVNESLSIEHAKFLKKHWLKGYEEIKKPNLSKPQGQPEIIKETKPYNYQFDGQTDKLGDYLRLNTPLDDSYIIKKEYFDKKTGKKLGNGGYTEWKSQLPKNLQYEGDYDLRGLYESNPNVKPSANIHFPDTYKLPNHPTFSNESKYFNFVQPQIVNQAGHWDETDSSYNYIPYNPAVKDTIIEQKKFGGQINELDMVKNGKKIKMKLKKADTGKFIPTSDGNTYNEFGIEEDPQSLQETQYDPITGEKLTNNYNQFNPSLTYGLQNYYQSKNKKAPAYLSAEEGSQYADYIAQQPQQPNWGQNNNSTFTPHNSVSGLSQNFQKIGSGAQKMAKGDWKGAISDWGGTEFELAKGFSNIAVAQKTNRRLEKNQADLLKKSLTQPYLNDYNDNQFGYSKVPLSKYGIKLPKANYGIPSKFEGKTHAEGGEPINTNMQFNNANDLKTPRHLANLEVETDEYLLPQAELGTQKPSMGVLSAKKRVGFTMKAKNGKNIKVSPSEAVDEMAKIEGIPTPDKMNKYISKREEFIKDNKNFAPSDTQNALDILLPQYKAKIDPITNLAFNLQEQRKEELGISDAPQAKFGRLMKAENGALTKEDIDLWKTVKYGDATKNPKLQQLAKKIRESGLLGNAWKDAGLKGEPGNDGTGFSDDEILASFNEKNYDLGKFLNLPTQQQALQITQNPYNIQPDKRKLDPTYSKMGLQQTPTGVKYEPLTPQQINKWSNLETSLNLAHPNGIPFSDNAQGYYKDASGKPITDKQLLTNVGYQEQYYDDQLETPEGRQELAKMWQEKGKTLKGKGLSVATDNLTKLNDAELYDKLNSLRPAYLDTYPKVRIGEKYYNPNKTVNIKGKAPQAPASPYEIPKITPEAGIKGKGKNPNMQFIPTLAFNEPYLLSPEPLWQETPNLVDYRSPDIEKNLLENRKIASMLGKGSSPINKANLFGKLTEANNQVYGNAFNTMQQGKQAVDQFNAQTLQGVQQRNIGNAGNFWDRVSRGRGNLATQQLMDRQQLNDNFGDLTHQQMTQDYLSNIYDTSGISPDLSGNYIQPTATKTKKQPTKVRKYGGKVKLNVKKKNK